MRAIPHPFLYTIAGTNGKGSCASLLATALHASGFRYALYTSPHVRSFNERACIDGAAATDEDWCSALQEVEEARQKTKLPLTYFEYATLAAFLLFSRYDLDVWILEVGLGGRLDAVNVMDADCAVITSIGLDHTDYLGNTREAIFAEKIAIARENKPLIYADPSPPANLRQLKDEKGVRFFAVNDEFGSRRGRLAGMEFLTKGEIFYAHNDEELLMTESSPQLSLHYATAWQGLCLLKENGIHDMRRRAAKIASSWRGFNLLGRWQIQQCGQARFIFDVAHNPQAAELMARRIAALREPADMIFGIMKDKEWRGFIQPLLSLVGHWHLFPLAEERALSVAELSYMLKNAGAQVSIYSDKGSLLTRLTRQKKIFVISGSFHTVGEIFEGLEAQEKI